MQSNTFVVYFSLLPTPIHRPSSSRITKIHTMISRCSSGLLGHCGHVLVDGEVSRPMREFDDTGFMFNETYLSLAHLLSL